MCRMVNLRPQNIRYLVRRNGDNAVRGPGLENGSLLGREGERWAERIPSSQLVERRLTQTPRSCLETIIQACVHFVELELADHLLKLKLMGGLSPLKLGMTEKHCYH